MAADPPRTPPMSPGPRSPVAARLVTSAPEGLLRLEFTAPPEGAWTLVRAELARRLAEQAVSQAATVSDADLATFARGRGLPRRTAEPAPDAPAEAAPAPVVAPTRSPALVVATLPPPPGDSPASGMTPADALRRPDMLTGEALAVALGLSRATVALRRQAGRLLALESGAKRGFRYPAWQVRPLLDPVTRDAFEEALRLLAPQGAWANYRFFTEPRSPDGRTPLELLERGDVPGFDSRLRASVG